MPSKFIFLSILLIALLSRLWGIGSFMTVDEENWMIRSSQFGHALLRGDPSSTFLTTHPGAVAMWIIGVGEIGQEIRLGQVVDTSNLSHFRASATIPMALFSAALITFITWLLSKTTSLFVAWWAGFLISVDPYITGMGQIAHLDELLALLLLCAILATWWYTRSKHVRPLFIAGVALGLALGTKTLPAVYGGLFMGLLLLMQYGLTIKTQWRLLLSHSAFVAGIAVLTFFAVWPALWVKTDLNNSFERDIVTIATEEHVVVEEEGVELAAWSFYARTIVGRVTPFILLVTIGALFIGIIQLLRTKKISLTLWLFLYAVGFILLIGFVAKRADRYALPALVVLPVVCAIALDFTWRLARWSRLKKNSVAIAVVVLLCAQLGLWAPYAIAYNNPVFNVRPLSQQGWGEGLDEVATWLNAHPLADRLTVASWYPGVLSTYFNGKTTSLSARDDNRVGFVVLYRNMYGRGGDTIAGDVIDEFKHKTPEHVVFIHGLPYAWIYNTIGLRYFIKHTGEVLPGMDIGQTVQPKRDSWDYVDIGLATFSGRLNTSDLTLHVRESAETTEDLRTVTVNTSSIQDGSWQRFSFEPITEAQGKTFYVAISSANASPGNAVAIRFIDRDILPGDLFFRFNRPGWDMAYRLE